MVVVMFPAAPTAPMIDFRPDHPVRGESLDAVCRRVAAANGITAGQLLHARPDDQALKVPRSPPPAARRPLAAAALVPLSTKYVAPQRHHR
jgi:hypothetical protein